jgi:hypothetical protein
MPQGLLQVDGFVTPQILLCTVSGATNPAKCNFRNILPVTPTHSIFCGENFFASQWNQDFSGTQGEGGRAADSGQWLVGEERIRCTGS